MFEGLKFHHWRWEIVADDVCHLILDRSEESTNALGSTVMAELGQALERIAIDLPRGLIISSGKPDSFVVGADITEFQDFARQGSVFESIRSGQKVFDRLAQLPCPTVAAIHGACMGGGTEMALACDQRVASNDPKTRIGLPEVMLGIHPGWGGTVRLPRLIGAPAALDMILQGRSLSADAARAKGLVDRVTTCEQLVATAQKLIQRPGRSSGGWRSWLSNTYLARQALALVVGRKLKPRVNPSHYPAPYAALELWRRHGGNPERMMVAEARSVARLAETETARNLVRIFFLRQRVRALGVESEAPIKHIHVVGAGVMGGDIAAWCALRGFTVTLQDREDKYVAPAIARAEKLFEKKLRKPPRVAEAKARLSSDVPGDGVDDADLIIEAIYENLEAKRELYAEIEPRMKDTALLATNTSSIPLQDLASGLKRPERFVGLHFFNPVAKMLLLEIVQHEALDAAVMQQAAGFAKAIDRLGIPVTSTPGFLVNRILMPYLLEAFKLHSEGVPGPVIDRAAKRFGMPMGPIELADQVGLDVCASVASVLGEAFGLDVPEGLDEYIEAGKRGRKDGEGIYRYEDGKPVKPDVESGYTPPSDLTDRLVLAFVNEAVRCLREGVVSDADLLDAGMIFGTGFAPFRGGPCQYARDAGPEKLRARLAELQQEHGDRFAPDAGWEAL